METIQKDTLYLGVTNTVDKKKLFMLSAIFRHKNYSNINLDFSKFRNAFSPYESKPAFTLWKFFPSCRCTHNPV